MWSRRHWQHWLTQNCSVREVRAMVHEKRGARESHLCVRSERRKDEGKDN